MKQNITSQVYTKQ